MSDTLQQARLETMGLSASVAAKLVLAGLGIPKLIKSASDQALRDAGLSSGEVSDVRSRFPVSLA